MLTFLQEFISDIKAQKLRTTLTLFGIIWGTIAIVVLLAVGEGFKNQTMKNMHGMGTRIAIIFGGATTKPHEGFGIGRGIRMTQEDARLLEQQIPGIEHATGEFRNNSAVVEYKNNGMRPAIIGVELIYTELRNIFPQPGGRWLNQKDLDDQRKVALIGNKAKETLFGSENAIGKTILVGNVPFTIIGVMQEKTQNSNYGTPDEDCIFIPITTYKSMFWSNYVNNMLYRVYNPEEAEGIRTLVREVLGKKHKFNSTDEGAIFIWDTVESDKFIFYFFLGFNIFLGILGIFTLAVGGIGVANIMYIVVQERIMEIGVRRAVGATRLSIMIQFLTETFLIVFLGAFIGFLGGLAILEIINLLPIEEVVGRPSLSFNVAFISVSVLMIIGLAAGFLPAKKASTLDVVECLRT